MEYNFEGIESFWQKYWKENQTYKVSNVSEKPKYYVLDMFPYPSGAGLHVGHPLGYIATDIYTRYKRLQGFNVLHPMGFDAYGLPAEQYAIQTGQHPAITTQRNIVRYREQLDRLGFSFDWDREVRTCDPAYYHWTQWVFIRLFNSWYDKKRNKAIDINDLIKIFNQEGNRRIVEQEQASCSVHPLFTAKEWLSFSEKEQQQVLMNYRLAYLSDTLVNWCPVLGTVLANDEVINGLSQRGGHPVERKRMRQWSLRITAYAERLLDGLREVDWSDSLKEMQKNWIGKSIGASLRFRLDENQSSSLPALNSIEVFTTRPDTLFGVSFMVLCPEHESIASLTTPDRKEEVETYLQLTKNRTERERQSEVNKVSGVFTGSYALHPFTGEKLPIWVSDYVLAGYGTGAIMAVAAHDSRDYRFACQFNLPIKPVVSGGDISKQAYEAKDGVLIHSDFLNGLKVKEAILRMIEEIERLGLGKSKVNYRLRDAIFSRQRYWGEPFPVYYKDNMPYTLNENELPLELPEIDQYLPTDKGEPPLARAVHWVNKDGYPLETNTMPGFAGSSAYYLRYMDPHNDQNLVGSQANQYWQEVDLYMGGAEHATGHLIYSRFWNKFLYDLGIVCKEEPYKKLINQGMIQGRSSFVFRLNYFSYREYLKKNPIPTELKDISDKDIQDGTRLIFVSKNLHDRSEYTDTVHVDIHLVHNDILDTEGFKTWMPHFASSEFILENGNYICGAEVEKMSKSMYNVQNPDEIVSQYGADTLRMYEMFLGPIEQSKPWDTKGIEGVFRFLKKYWRLYFKEEENFKLSEEEPTKEEWKLLHSAIGKIQKDTERFSFNTAVSSFMITVNELTELKCDKKAILEPLCILLSPYAPHIAEEVWKAMGHKESITYASYPVYEEKYTIENNFNYPVSFNGKMRFSIELALSMSPAEIELAVLNSPLSLKWLDGKSPKKIIVVPGRIINVVL
ncbi:MAG: class I tRNA ligase family protein [Bacteroidales bacterium]